MSKVQKLPDIYIDPDAIDPPYDVVFINNRKVKIIIRDWQVILPTSKLKKLITDSIKKHDDRRAKICYTKYTR